MLIRRIKNYLTDMTHLRKDDVILAAYPKTGSTWVRFILCNLISLNEWDGKIVDFETLNDTLYSFGQGRLPQEWPYRTLPRVVVTHRLYRWPLFRDRKAVLVIRDPRDAMISRFHYESQKRPDHHPFKGTFLEFLRHPRLGLPGYFHHYRTWKDHVQTVVKYENLKNRPEEELQKILDILGIHPDPLALRESIQRSSIEKVRAIEDQVGHKRREASHVEGFKFTRNGRAGQWRDVFTAEEIQVYEECRRRYRFDLYHEE
ncbi:MAG: sulfotransferase domain-containing protein [bacterium]